MTDRQTIRNMTIQNGHAMYEALKEAYRASAVATIALDRFDHRATPILEDYQLIANYIQHLMRKTAELNEQVKDLITTYDD